MISNNKKLIKWDGLKLYLKDISTGEEVTLGKINTRKGGLTRAQKLKAVQHTDKWIEV